MSRLSFTRYFLSFGNKNAFQIFQKAKLQTNQFFALLCTNEIVTKLFMASIQEDGRLPFENFIQFA